MAETLIPSLPPDADSAVDIANDRLGRIAARYRTEWLAVMRGKLGLVGEDDTDAALADDLMTAMQGADWTLTFRRLADPAALRPLFDDFRAMEAWLPRWRARAGDGAAQRIAQANPAVIPRNHKVEEALTAATDGDMAPFHALLSAIQQPFVENEPYMLPRPPVSASTSPSAAPDDIRRALWNSRPSPLPRAEMTDQAFLDHITATLAQIEADGR